MVETYEVYNHLHIPKAWEHYFVERKLFFIAKSYESIVSVVPVRFAFLETMFLSSESVREVFWASHHQGALEG